MKNPSEELTTAPENATLIFGDGYFAQIGNGGHVEIGEDGIALVNIPIKPHINLQKAYGIHPDKLNKMGFMWFTALRNHIFPINEFDNSNRVWIYEYNYDHTKTPISERYEDLTLQLDAANRNIWAWEGEVIKLSEDNELLKNNPAELLNTAMEIGDRMASKSMEMIGMRPQQ